MLSENAQILLEAFRTSGGIKRKLAALALAGTLGAYGGSITTHKANVKTMGSIEQSHKKAVEKASDKSHLKAHKKGYTAGWEAAKKHGKTHELKHYPENKKISSLEPKGKKGDVKWVKHFENESLSTNAKVVLKSFEAEI